MSFHRPSRQFALRASVPFSFCRFSNLLMCLDLDMIACLMSLTCNSTNVGCEAHLVCRLVLVEEEGCDGAGGGIDDRPGPDLGR